MDVPPRTCVVVPTFNEKENVEPLVLAIEKVALPGVSVLFVDDNSPDGTGEEISRVAATRPWVRLLRRGGKMGIGSAYQDGFNVALAETKPSVLVEMDADLQHPPAVLPDLVEAIRGGADVAVASRYVPGGGVSGWSLIRRTVSRGANAYSRMALGLKVKDATSGFRAYTEQAARQVASANLPAKGFEFQVASLHLLKGSAKVVEVPFIFESRVAAKSKLGLSDVLRFFFAVIRISFRG